MIQENAYTSNLVKEACVVINGQVFSYLDSGLTRDVFVNEDKTVVIKIDKEKGFNEEELRIYESARPDVQKNMARTWQEDGYLFQEYLDREWQSKVPLDQFVWAAKSRNEVGLDKDGNLKCYDLSEYMRY